MFLKVTVQKRLHQGILGTDRIKIGYKLGYRKEICMLKFETLIDEEKSESLKSMKIQFNERVARINKADEYYRNPNTTEADIERTIDTLILLLKELSMIGNEIEKIFNIEITTDIVINGFKDI